MNRIMVAMVISGLVAAIVVWSNVIQVKPELAAQAEEARPILSPFDIMIMHGKNARVEEWRDAI